MAKKGCGRPSLFDRRVHKDFLGCSFPSNISISRTITSRFSKGILKDLEFSPEFLRLQCEREIKGKLLLLREAFLETSGKGKALRGLITQALPALLAIFEALLHLKDIDVPREKRAIVRVMAEAFDLEQGVFEGLLDIKEDKSKISDEESLNLFKGCLKEMRKLSKLVNALGG